MSGVNTMLALTVRQPYAAALVYGPKSVENRPWAMPPKVRPGDWVAVHAAGQLYEMDERGWRRFVELWPTAPRDEDEARMIKGALIGVMRFAGTVTDQTIGRAAEQFKGGEMRDALAWFGGPYGLLFDIRRSLMQPIPCRGQLGMWKVDEEHRKSLDLAINSVGNPRPVPAIPAWDVTL